MKGKKKDLSPGLSDLSTMFFTIVLPVLASKDINLLKIMHVCVCVCVYLCVCWVGRIERM